MNKGFFPSLVLFQLLLFIKHFGHSILGTYEFLYIHLLGKLTEYMYLQIENNLLFVCFFTFFPTFSARE